MKKATKNDSVRHVLMLLNPWKFRGTIARYAMDHNWVFQTCDDPFVPRDWVGDGVLVSFYRKDPQDDYIKKLAQKKNIPIVGLSYAHPEIKIHRVIPDFVGLGRLGAEHLWRRSYKSYAFCSTDRITGAKISYEAYLDELRRFGFKGDVPWIVLSEVVPSARRDNWENNIKSVGRLLTEMPKPVGIMCMSDTAASDLCACATGSGLRIPRDVGVIGSNDDPFECEIRKYPLTSENPNYKEIALRGCEMLDRLMDGEELPMDPVVVPPLGIFDRSTTGLPNVTNPMVMRAVEIMGEHLSGDISLKEIADMLGVSPSKLNREFHEAGCGTPAAQMRELRLCKAKSLLRTTNHTLSEIADMTGFAHAAHFLNVFRSFVGETPNIWREKWT